MTISSNIKRRKVKLSKPIDFIEFETGLPVHFDVGDIFYNYKPPMLEWQEWFYNYQQGMGLQLSMDEYEIIQEPAPDKE